MNPIKFFFGERYHPVLLGLSVAVSWTWAPALILSTDIAANSGFLGVLSFIVPNIMTLILFSYIGNRISPWELFSFGSTAIRLIYEMVELFCIIIQATACGNILAVLFGVPYSIGVILFVLASVAVSMNGFHSSVLSSVYVKIIGTIIPLVLLVHTILNTTLESTSIEIGTFSLQKTLLFSAILWSGPIMTNQHWLKYDRKGHKWAALFFGIPLISLTAIGLLSGIKGEYTSLRIFTGVWGYMFGVLVLTNLSSTVQSAFSSLSTLSIVNRELNVGRARVRQIVLAVVGMSITLMNAPILILWQMMGIFRFVIALIVLWRYYVAYRKGCIPNSLPITTNG